MPGAFNRDQNHCATLRTLRCRRLQEPVLPIGWWLAAIRLSEDSSVSGTGTQRPFVTPFVLASSKRHVVIAQSVDCHDRDRAGLRA